MSVAAATRTKAIPEVSGAAVVHEWPPVADAHQGRCDEPAARAHIDGQVVRERRTVVAGGALGAGALEEQASPLGLFAVEALRRPHRLGNRIEERQEGRLLARVEALVQAHAVGHDVVHQRIEGVELGVPVEGAQVTDATLERLRPARASSQPPRARIGAPTRMA